MALEPQDAPRTTAIEQLELLGLGTYAARTYVALVSLGSGTAKDVSDVADVPRTRVYDAAQELHREGLVDIRQSSPQRFSPVSAETTGRKFDREFTRRVATLTTALNELEPIDLREEQRGVWTVTGRSAIEDRVAEFFAGAEEHIVYMTVESLLTEEVIGALGDAADRGVTITLGGVSPEVRTRIRDAVPGAELFDSLWLWSDTPAGRLLLVDGEKTLASVLPREPDEEYADGTADPPAETAIWGSGETNSLVVVLKAIFAWQLDDRE